MSNWSEEAALSAIRLALVAGANDRAKVTMIELLVDMAEETPASNTSGPKMFIEAIQAGGVHLEVAGGTGA